MRYLCILFASVLTATLSASGGSCPKCEIMKKYNSEHPGSYAYYEDYLESLKKKGTAGEKTPKEDLPDDVRQIMKQEKVSSANAEKK